MTTGAHKEDTSKKDADAENADINESAENDADGNEEAIENEAAADNETTTPAALEQSVIDKMQENILAASPSSEGASDGKITGVDSTMEYSLDNGETWTDVSGTEISGLEAGSTVLLRIKETETTGAGPIITVTIPDYETPAASGIGQGSLTLDEAEDGVSEKGSGLIWLWILLPIIILSGAGLVLWKKKSR